MKLEEAKDAVWERGQRVPYQRETEWPYRLAPRGNRRMRPGAKRLFTQENALRRGRGPARAILF